MENLSQLSLTGAMYVAVCAICRSRDQVNLPGHNYYHFYRCLVADLRGKCCAVQSTDEAALICCWFAQRVWAEAEAEKIRLQMQ